MPASRIAICDLRAEYQIDPVGIDVVQPRLSWKLEAAERGVRQSAYQIQVVRGDQPPAANEPVLWDTGKIASDASIQQPYRGPAPQSRQRFWWKVRVWDAHDDASDWSAFAFWEMGLLEHSDWHARWIAPTHSEPRAPYLRQSLVLRNGIRRARAYVTSLGLYQLFINGRRVSDWELTPGFTSYDKRLQYQTYDVTDLLRDGKNAIGALLGGGWYTETLSLGSLWDSKQYGDRPCFLAQLEVSYEDGETETIVSDENWRSAPSPILMSGIYAGETYDARLERLGWAEPEPLKAEWEGVQAEPLVPDILVAQAGPPVRRMQELTPIGIWQSPTGETIVDIGQNMAGWVRLRAKGPAGTTITLRHGEILDADGNLYVANLDGADQTIRYTLRGGNAVEIYEPHFTFQGFRYVAVDGYPGTLSAEDITGIVVHSDIDQTSEFETSDDRLNQLQRNIIWSQRGNFLDIPLDCPQRFERLGWTDTQVFAPTAMFNMDVALFFTKWLKDLAADQYEDGSVPWVVPDTARIVKVGPEPELVGSRAAGAAGWGDSATILPWELYLAYGDKRILEQQFRSMTAWVDYEHSRAGDDLVWSGDYQWGDWVASDGPQTSKDLVATAYFARSADLVARVARLLGRSEESRRYSELFANIRDAFNRAFVAEDTTIGAGTQTAYVLALQFDLLPPERRAAAARLLAEHVRRTGHLTTGFLGTKWLLFALSTFGYLDEAYALLLREDYPSWLYPLKYGATTMWEHWDGIKPDGSLQDPAMNSFNHYGKGAVGDWMYRAMAGINIDPDQPGYKHALIAPRPGGGIRRVAASHLTPYGKLSTQWRIEGDAFALDVAIPANTTATVILPSTSSQKVFERDRPIVVGDGIVSFANVGPNAQIELGSGTYQFRCSMNAH